MCTPDARSFWIGENRYIFSRVGKVVELKQLSGAEWLMDKTFRDIGHIYMCN